MSDLVVSAKTSPPNGQGADGMIVIPHYERPGKDRSVGVRRRTYEKLRAIKRRTGQSYAAILEILVERAQ